MEEATKKEERKDKVIENRKKGIMKHGGKKQKCQYSYFGNIRVKNIF